MRPLPGLHDYRTPTRGLYLSGVGTWPGNYVSGIPGHNTSQAVLEDLREGRHRIAAKSVVAGA
jgi:phytoene dehydrogenase-like protein